MSQFSTNNLLSQKWFKIDGYIQRGVLQALNPLSSRVNLSRLFQGRTQWKPKCVKKCTKMANVWTGWITGKRLKADGYMLRCVWQALNPLFIHVMMWNLPRFSQGRTQGRLKCVLDSLDVAKCPYPQNGWRQRHTGVTLLSLWIRLVFMQLTRDLFAIAKFLFNVRQNTDARYSYRLDVRLFVRPSVTRWYCDKTAQPIVKLSSLPGSPMILVFWYPNFYPEFQCEHPNGGVKCKGVEKSCNFRPISRNSS